MRTRGKDARRLLLAAGVTIAAALAAPAAAAASSAVVLVSGFDTATPFSTSDPSCAGKEGPTWSDPNGPGAALKAAGLTVFTAPVHQGGEAIPSPCLGSGQAAPPATAAIDSNGDVDANGAALVELLAFLRSSYGVDSVALVGHSDGGLWSRSAITQLQPSAGVTVQSLTTMATPHTGSFGADLAETLHNGQCDEANEVEQVICEAALVAIEAVYADLGPDTIKQLSSTFLEGWNPQQRLSCPVAVMGGTYVDIPLVPLTYYNPNDGIVGEASALARSAFSITLQTIPAPGFQAIGGQTFPVVHSSVLTFLTPNTMLNQSAISQTVLQAVQAGTSSTPCLAGQAPAPATDAPPQPIDPPIQPVDPAPQPLSPATARSAAAEAPARAQAAQAAGAPVRAHAGFRALETPRRGRIARPTAGTTLLLLDGATARCRGRAIPAVPLLGSDAVSVAAPRCHRALRVRGRALVLRPSARRAIAVQRAGRALQVRVTGPRLRRLRAEVEVRPGTWRALRIGRTVRLPRRADAVAVRVLGRDRAGERYAATAHVAG